MVFYIGNPVFIYLILVAFPFGQGKLFMRCAYILQNGFQFLQGFRLLKCFASSADSWHPSQFPMILTAKGAKVFAKFAEYFLLIFSTFFLASSADAWRPSRFPKVLTAKGAEVFAKFAVYFLFLFSTSFFVSSAGAWRPSRLILIGLLIINSQVFVLKLRTRPCELQLRVFIIFQTFGNQFNRMKAFFQHHLRSTCSF